MAAIRLLFLRADAPPEVRFDERIQIAVQDRGGVAGFVAGAGVFDVLLRVQDVVPGGFAAEADLGFLARGGRRPRLRVFPPRPDRAWRSAFCGRWPGFCAGSARSGTARLRPWECASAESRNPSCSRAAHPRRPRGKCLRGRFSDRPKAMSISMLSSGSGVTSTAANEVCRRPAESNGLMRISRWLPLSPLR